MGWELAVSFICAAFVIGFIAGLAFAAFTASNFGRRRPTPPRRTWPQPTRDSGTK
jgi:hypothetical protein